MNETVTIRAGIVGMADEGLGTAHVVLDLDDPNPDAIGRALADGFRAAHSAAIREVAPKLTAVWVEQKDRLTDGDQETDA